MIHTDLDMIESIVREAMDHLPPNEQEHEAIEMRCVDVRALVRAVRAAIAVRTGPCARLLVDLDTLDSALAPFRKEAT